ncbi:MAG: hypothetical protein PPP58_04695 [Natronomonas sp.]
MTTSFQRAVNKSVPRTARKDAIDTLVRDDQRRNLAVLVRTGGLSGEFRRQAIDGLGECAATDTLSELAADRSLEPSLRERATELA